MASLFGKKKKAEPKKAPSTIEVIAKLKETQDLIEKRQAHLERQRDQCKQMGQAAMKANDKKKAMFQLRSMKQYDKQIESNWGKINNLQQQCMTLESAATDQSIFEAMKMAQDKMKETINEESLDKVADLMDDIVEQQQMQDEISDALARPIGEEIDEDELFDAFMTEEAEEEEELNFDFGALPDVKTNKNTNTATATTAKAKPVVEEEDELAGLMM